MKIKGQIGLVAALVYIMVAVIVGIGVVVPVATTTINNASLSGTTLTVVNNIPLMVAVVLFMAVAYLITAGR